VPDTPGVLVIALPPRFSRSTLNDVDDGTAVTLYTPFARFRGTDTPAMVTPASDRNMLFDVVRPCANDVVNVAVEVVAVMLMAERIMEPYSTYPTTLLMVALL